MNIIYLIDIGSDLIIDMLNSLWTALNWILENIGSLGMFVLTLFYVVYTKRLMQQGEANLKQARKPEVIAYFELDRANILNFMVKNIGSSPAIDVTINFTMLRGEINDERFHSTYMLNHPISTLAPEQNIFTFVDILPNLIDTNKDFPMVKIDLEYYDSKKDKYIESFVLDINMYKGTSRVNNKETHDLVKEVEKIRKLLQKR
ncbi:hypothetical protein [Bacillus seohaeanensis]|uniref:Uncharacterized protein n=1 Tax=Bacillus seohaeanensis TaxID=284580 RepID=A0ABW5RMA1_9BACI